MQRISFIHVTFDFMVTELHFFFGQSNAKPFFFWRGGGGLFWTGFFKVSSECESHVINKLPTGSYAML